MKALHIRKLDHFERGDQNYETNTFKSTTDFIHTDRYSLTAPLILSPN